MAQYTDGVNIVEAEQYDGINYEPIYQLTHTSVPDPIVRIDFLKDGEAATICVSAGNFDITTDDYFIKHEDGSFTMMDPVTFEATYTSV